MAGKTLWLPLLALLALPVSAAAQERPMRGDRPMARMFEEQNSPIHYLLEQQQKLRLTGEQRAKLEELDRELREQNAPLIEQARALRPEQPPEPGTRPDRDAMRERMEKVRPLMQQIRESHEQALKQALEALNAEQYKVARELLDARREEMRARRRPGGRGAGRGPGGSASRS